MRPELLIGVALGVYVGAAFTIYHWIAKGMLRGSDSITQFVLRHLRSDRHGIPEDLRHRRSDRDGVHGAGAGAEKNVA